MLRKYWIEIVALLTFLALAASVAFHCNRKAVPSGASLSTMAADAAATTDWALIAQVVSAVIVALIGVSPALIRAIKSGKEELIANEVEKDIRLVVEKTSPILTPQQLAEVKAMIDKGATLVDAYDAVKKRD